MTNRPTPEESGDAESGPGDVARQNAGGSGARPERKRRPPRGRLRTVADYDKEIARNKRLRSRALARERRKERDERDAERKLRNRRLVILGGALLAAAKGGDEHARRLVAAAVEHLRPADRPPFVDWKPDWESDDGQ